MTRRFAPLGRFVRFVSLPAMFVGFAAVMMWGMTAAPQWQDVSADRQAPMRPALIAAPAETPAKPRTFSFKDPKGVNTVAFFVDSPIEPIVGMGSGIEGQIQYDPANPTSFKGQISLSAQGLTVGNPKMAQHLQTAKWLNVAEHAKIVFTFQSAELVEQDAKEHAAQLRVTGKLSLAGVTKPMTIPVLATYVPGAASERGGAEEGDLLVLRSSFDVDRMAFGIQPDLSGRKVGQTISLMVPIVGYSQD